MIEERDERFDTASKCICERISTALFNLPADVKKHTQEIRLRVNRPVCICCAEGTYFLGPGGRLACRVIPGLLVAERRDLEESFRNLCSYSIYSHENEIKNGYITLSGGHRAGICGTAVLQSAVIGSVREISSINLRISREIRGAADLLLDQLGNRLQEGLLLAGAPSSGKTTILRDLARQLSGGSRGNLKKVAVVDERGEIAGTYMGVPQNDLGCCCDVLDGYPKADGILLAVRTLSPEIIICDEIGSESEVTAVEQGLNTGATMIASIHAGSVQELMRRVQTQKLLRTGAFASVALLDAKHGPGKIAGIYKAGDLLAEAVGGASADYGGNSLGLYGIA
ncbi:stage III sporulation protein AA [Caproicibacter fermentans]|uniref:Stage III sporulation protein AA n=1 Tax=Caproicibacter fermentans TaxID=2576756 RepID=A0A7G8TCC1_9FIRM|nr:stage III sporulation protein AA [Caproicibacter fermentans]QNK41262.1 stage III sporulation protein AA [Caproicibacter fermentans]